MGWLKCQGTWLNKSEYGILFNVIGGTFGETSTQFRLPDPQGRVIGAVGSGSGLTTREKGDNVGAETHTLTISEMPTHNHTGTSDSSGLHSHNILSINDDYNNSSGAYLDQQKASFGGHDSGSKTWTNMVESNGSHTHTFTTSNTGNSNAHNNMQPTLFYGNMFIYCGLPQAGSYPYTTGKNLW
jgi:microcystin-dependent protein